jgi:hypothetical protein
MGKTSADGEKKPDVERNPEEVTTDQKNVPGAKIETRTKVRISSRQPQNQTVKFSKPDHPVSMTPSQKQPSRTTAPGMALAPRWCPPVLTPSQRRRIQRMTAQKMWEEAVKKERDEYFNVIRSVIPMKQEWRVNATSHP